MCHYEHVAQLMERPDAPKHSQSMFKRAYMAKKNTTVVIVEGACNF